MQTTSPLRMASLAVLQRADHLSGPLLRRDRDRPCRPRKQADDRAIVKSLEYQKANLPLRGTPEQQGIDQREMIGDQQRSAFGRNIVAALDSHAVDRVDENPHHKPEQRDRHEFDRIERRNERHQPAEEKHGGDREMQQTRQAGVHEARQANANERQLIRRGDDAALFSQGPADAG